MGPSSRHVPAIAHAVDLSNEAFPFGTSREIDLGYARVRASRITYVGELGWELYVPTEFATGVFDALVDGGRRSRPAPRRLPRPRLAAHGEGLPPLGPRHHARRHARSRPASASPSRGTRPAASSAGTHSLAQREAGLRTRLVQFALADYDKLLYHNEPIWRDGVIVGSITSGHSGHTIDCLPRDGLGVGAGMAVADARLGDWRRLRDRGRRRACTGTGRRCEPWYDPKSHRVRSDVARATGVGRPWPSER